MASIFFPARTSSMYSWSLRSNSRVFCDNLLNHASDVSIITFTFIFRSADLFSLHHASASVQLLCSSAASIRRISENSSISTSRCTTSEQRSDRVSTMSHLYSSLLSNHAGSLLLTVSQSPVNKPAVQTCIRPSCKVWTAARLNILNGS